MTFEEKVIELFNKYDVLLVHLDGKIQPVKNTSKQECYNLLYDIQELIEWRRLVFKKYYTCDVGYDETLKEILEKIRGENND